MKVGTRITATTSALAAITLGAYALVNLRGHKFGVHGLAWAPDGRRLATVALDGATLLWDANTGEKLRVEPGRTTAVLSVAFSPDGHFYATVGRDQVVRVWDATSGEERRTYRGHTDAINGVAFRPDGKQLASTASDDTVRVWDGTPLK